MILWQNYSTNIEKTNLFMAFPTAYAFWLLIFIVFYSYIGYGIVLGILVKLKKLFNHSVAPPQYIEPEVTFLVAAYNEEQWIEDKIRNSLALDYPKDKIQFFFVTDGSNDSTPDRIINFKNIEGRNLDTFGTEGYHIELLKTIKMSSQKA